jgi:hypothetical protein
MSFDIHDDRGLGFGKAHYWTIDPGGVVWIDESDYFRRPPQDAQEPPEEAPEGGEAWEGLSAPQIAAERLLAASQLLSDRHTRLAFEEVAYALRGATAPERVGWAESVAKMLGA